MIAIILRYVDVPHLIGVVVRGGVLVEYMASIHTIKAKQVRPVEVLASALSAKGGARRMSCKSVHMLLRSSSMTSA
jgi:hypothetical protein